MFVVALGVFVVASALGGIANDGGLLIATRFVKGVSAAFTAPAGLSIITTSFREGAARNKALTVYTATGATGFSLGLVFGGLLTELGWRWVFLLPAPVALVALAGAVRFVPRDGIRAHVARRFDVAGAALLTGAMLLLVYTVVEAPTVGWATGRTAGSFAAVAALLVAFVAREQRAAAPLVRLGILRSQTLVRANLGAMMLFGSWVGFQFIATLYMQQLRGWSALDTGLAIFPGGALVAVLSPGVAQLIARVGPTRLIVAGLLAASGAFALFIPIGLTSGYAPSVLPTMILAGIGFALAFAPLNVAGTNGVAPAEQGLAGGLLNTSFQFGGALVLAVVTAVINANTDGTSPQGLLDGFHPALFVSVFAALAGAAAVGLRIPRRAGEAVVAELETDAQPEVEAA
jgi:MFS family permease